MKAVRTRRACARELFSENDAIIVKNLVHMHWERLFSPRCYILFRLSYTELSAKGKLKFLGRQLPLQEILNERHPRCYYFMLL